MERPGSRGRRTLLVTVIYAWVFTIVLAILIQMSRSLIGDGVYFGILIANMHLCVAAVIAFFVYRYVRTQYWEHVACAIAVAGTAGMYLATPYLVRRVPAPVLGTVVLLSLLIAIVASVSLVARRRRLLCANAVDFLAPGQNM